MRNDDPRNFDLYDTRTVKRMIAAGRLTEDDYKRYLDSLEDCAEQATETGTRLVPTAAQRMQEKAANI